MIMMKKNSLAVIALATALAFAGCSAAAEISGQSEAQVQIPVATTAPEKRDIINQGEYVGKVEPAKQVTIYPKAAGEVIAVNYEVGDKVEEGAILLELDAKTLETTIKQTEAAISSAQAKANLNLQMAQKNLDTLEYNEKKGLESAVNQAQSGVDQAKAGVESADNRLRAAETAQNSARKTYQDAKDSDFSDYSMQYTPDQADRMLSDQYKQAVLNVEQATIALENAKNSLATAEKGLQAAKSGMNTQKSSVEDSVQMAKLNANLNDQYINIQRLKDDLANYKVATKISGVIEQRNVDPYDMASQQTPVFVISNKDSVTVSFGVSEKALDYIKLGDTVEVEKDGAKIPAKVTEIGSAVDARTGLFIVEATINTKNNLHSGSNVKVFLDIEKKLGIVTIPIDAVFYDNGKPFVYLIAKNIAKKTFIETGASDNEIIEVISGITEADTIVNSWNSSLKDGAEVKLS